MIDYSIVITNLIYEAKKAKKKYRCDYYQCNKRNPIKENEIYLCVTSPKDKCNNKYHLSCGQKYVKERIEGLNSKIKLIRKFNKSLDDLK